MLSIKSLIESLGVFERNKVPFELKVLGLAFHIRLSSLRRVARALSEVHRVSKTAIWKWVGKLSERICVDPPKMPRRLVALDKTCVKVNGLEYRVYAAKYDVTSSASRRPCPSTPMPPTPMGLPQSHLNASSTQL